ncbi:MAG: ABC transporter substrate-binding protein [Chloroflexia bacterium]
MSRKTSAGLALLLATSMLLAACGGAADTPVPAPTNTTMAAPATDTTAAMPAATNTTAAMAAPTDTTAAVAAATNTTAPIGTVTVGPTPVVPAGVTTVKVVDWVPDNISSWANRWYKPFEDANPNIKIVHEQITGNYIETVLTRLTGSNDIDLIFVAPDNVGSFLRAGAALDLSSNIATDKAALQLDKFPQWTLDDYTTVRYPELKVGPGQYGLPVVEFVWEMWHNADLEKAAGISTPQRGWTWDDFTTMSKKLTDQSKHQYGYQNQAWLLPLWTWVWENGGNAMTPDAKTLTFGEKPSVDAFTYLQNLQINDKAFVPIDQTTGASPIGFDTGNAGMITRGNWNLDLSRDWKFKWDLSYPPKNKAEGTLGEELGMIINKNSPKKDAAWKVLSWVSGPEGEAALAPTDVVPNTAVMRQLGLQAVPQNVRNLVVPLSSDPMVHSSPQWFRPKYTANDLNDRLSVLWTGEKKAADLLPALQKEFNDALAKPLP